MNRITALMVFVCVAAGADAVYWLHPYVGLVLLAVGMILAASLKLPTVEHRSQVPF
jgi:hypothetical protein